MISRDGLWRVTVVSIDGHPRIRVEYRGLLGWVWRAEVTDPDQVAAYVPLSELQEQR